MDELIKIGKHRAEVKTGYEYGDKYDFRWFYSEIEWNEIIQKGLGAESQKYLVPFKKSTASVSDGSDTEGYEH